MKEYIERAKVLESLGYEENRRGDVLPGSTFDIILKEPAADVAPVRHGRWEMVPYNGVYDIRCSSCGYCPGIRFYSSNYCPNCGALMEKKEDDHD